MSHLFVIVWLAISRLMHVLDLCELTNMNKRHAAVLIRLF